MPSDDLSRVQELLAEFAARHFPGYAKGRLEIDVPGCDSACIPFGPHVRPCGGAAARAEVEREPFVPGDVQVAILTALEGQALKTDALASAANLDRRRLFKKDGVRELMDAGLVRWHRKLGYYREDTPPPELEGED